VRGWLSALVAGYLIWLSPALAPYAGGADSSGYLWSARLFRHASLSVPLDPPHDFPLDTVGASALAPLGTMVKSGTRDLVPTYPTGLPLHIAAANLLLPEESAVRSVLIATAGVTLVLLFVLARDAGLGPAWALAGCVVFAFSPLVLFVAVQPLSDLLATLWTQAAIVCAWRARRRPAIAFGAGVSLGIATLVRPTSLLLIPAVVAASPATWSAYRRLVVGGLPFAVFVAGYQAWAYGHPLSSGYGDVSAAFSLTNLGRSLIHYAVWLPKLASWLIVFGPGAAWAWTGDLGRWRLIVAAWVLAILGMYALYPVTAETWWSMRLVLPALPPLIVASLVGLREIVSRLTGRAAPNALTSALAVGVVAIAVLMLARQPEFGTRRELADGERVYRDALDVLRLDRSDRRAVLMVQMSGAANYYAPELHPIRYDALTPETWRAIRAWQSREHASIGAALMPFERDELFGGGAPRFPCAWEPRGHYLHITFWNCPP